MRIASGRVKLVVVNEPTSAMDPEGELQLFDGFRQGKTMIFALTDLAILPNTPMRALFLLMCLNLERINLCLIYTESTSNLITFKHRHL